MSQNFVVELYCKTLNMLPTCPEIPEILMFLDPKYPEKRTNLSKKILESTEYNEKALREMQRLHAGCSKAEPKNFHPTTDPFREHRMAKI